MTHLKYSMDLLLFDSYWLDSFSYSFYLVLGLVDFVLVLGLFTIDFDSKVFEYLVGLVLIAELLQHFRRA